MQTLSRLCIRTLVLTSALALGSSALAADRLKLGQDDLPVPGSEAATQEERDVNEIAAEVLKTVKLTHFWHPHETVHRDAHPKANGCVKAHFIVNSDLPADLKRGIFATPTESTPAGFKAWIRYSNGSPHALKRPDYKGDARGMAIKVIGVTSGERLLPGDERATQDFLLSNHPVFFIPSVHDYVTFMKSKPEFFGKDAVLHAFHTTKILEDTKDEFATNPLELTYYSQTPYRFGPASEEHAVKYKAIPVSCEKSEVPVSCDGEPASKTLQSKDPNGLREAMINTLKQGDSCFTFCAQFQKNPETMQISNSTLPWKEEESKFLPLATIQIKKSENDGKLDLGRQNQDRQDFCENLSMSPWHGIEDHHPMGGINRVRKTVYLTISSYRRDKNRVKPKKGVNPFEPTGNESF